MTDVDDIRLDALLRGTTPPPAPAADFADRVMARVALVSQDTPPGLVVAVPGDPLPWWIRAIGQPASALALVLAGLATAFSPQLLAVARDSANWGVVVQAWLFGPRLVHHRSSEFELAAMGLALVLAPLLSFALYRLGARIATARFAPPPAAARPVRARGA